jgi:putative transposase
VHRFIRAERANHAVATLWPHARGIAHGLYAPERRAPCRRQLEDDQLGVAIREIHRDSRETYGAPRVHAMLRRRGICVSRKRVARLMRRRRISGLVKRRRGKTTIRVPGVATAPDLVRRECNRRQRTASGSPT